MQNYQKHFQGFFRGKKIVKLIEERVENVNKSSHFFYNRQNGVAQQKLSKNPISRKKPSKLFNVSAAKQKL